MFGYAIFEEVLGKSLGTRKKNSGIFVRHVAGWWCKDLYDERVLLLPAKHVPFLSLIFRIKRIMMADHRTSKTFVGRYFLILLRNVIYHLL